MRITPELLPEPQWRTTWFWLSTFKVHLIPVKSPALPSASALQCLRIKIANTPKTADKSAKLF
jgi:hypothetical protein